jgi:hypothetical protein
MAIVVDTHSDATYDGGNVGSATLSHATASGCNLLVVSVSCRNVTVTGVTYNSVAMTLGKESTGVGSYGSVWYLANPDSGTHNAVATFSSSTGRYAISTLSLYGAKAVPNVTNFSVGTGSSSSVSFTTTVPGCIGVDAQYNAATTSGTPGANQSQMADYHGNDGGGTSYKENLAVGSNSMSWTSFSASDEYAQTVAAFAPSWKPKVNIII